VRPRSEIASVALDKRTLSYQTLLVMAAGFDACLLVVSSLLGSTIYQYWLTGRLMMIDGAVGVGVVAGAIFILLSRSSGLYQLQTALAPAQCLRHIDVIVAVTLLALVNILFLLKVGAEYSRGSMVAFAALAFVIVPLGRLVFAKMSALGIQRGFVGGNRVVLIGEASELETLCDAELRQFGIEEAARVRVSQSEAHTGLGETGGAQIARAIGLARAIHAVEFAVAIPWDRERLLTEISDLLRLSPLPVKLLPDHTIRHIVNGQRNLPSNAYLAVEIQREPLSRAERIAKRTLDLGLSLAAMIALTPVLLAAAAAIRLDSKGPILFRQRRCGFDNSEFVIFKFRTMTTLEDGDEVVQTSRGDARITRVGKLLRRSSIDELPQLLNVIRGEMSLVGPRPHAMAHDNQYKALIDSYAMRHHVKPGLTGMAQIHGLRGETRQLAKMEKRVEQDLWYIDNWSLTLDLKIMAQTCVALLRQDAY
jgi:undecaprenyl-phosphate galactose phosphotransferase/putative colanic acid biosynthesis UDP-glucose lipid carrier transferase